MQESIKSKVHTLRTIITFCQELQKTRNERSAEDETELIIKFCNEQLNALKDLVDHLNRENFK